MVITIITIARYKNLTYRGLQNGLEWPMCGEGMKFWCVQDIDVIFSNILDVHQLTQSLLSSLEDTLEATEENETPFVGLCFEELAEVLFRSLIYLTQLFDILKYSRCILLIVSYTQLITHAIFSTTFSYALLKVIWHWCTTKYNISFCCGFVIPVALYSLLRLSCQAVLYVTGQTTLML